MNDTLFLLSPDFRNPELPGQSFFCWHCALLEGVLSYYPELERHILVRRIAWPRPRQPLVDALGDAHQSLPVLVLAEGRRSERATGHVRGRDVIADKDGILRELSARYGIAVPHP